MTKFTFSSLFSCGGGADKGLEMSGGKGLWAIEIDPSFASTYKANFPTHTMIEDDVRSVNPQELEPPTILWCSPPCQAYSIARSKNLPNRTDGDVGLKLIEFVSVLKPSIVFLENVPPYQKSHVYSAIVGALQGMGYGTQDKIINFAELGVPQSRKRLVMMATKRGMEMRSLEMTPYPSVGWLSAIADLLPDGKDKPSHCPYVQPTELLPWQVKRLQKDGLWDTLPDTCLIQQVGANTNGKLMIRLPYEPMWTIRALGHSGHWKQATIRYKGHYYEINPRCLARWQGFPDDYHLPYILFPEVRAGVDAAACRIIGNSVPPLGVKNLMNALFSKGD